MINQMSKNLTFNLKAVVKETGVKHDALRAWEKRYGLPNPQRTEGGHRLYSQRDIDILKWLVGRQDEGLSISRAVNLWRQFEADGLDPLREMPLQPDFHPANTLAMPVQLPVDGNVARLRQTWLSACLAFDEQTAEQALAQSFALFSPEVACVEVLQKGLAEIGDNWYNGEVSVQQEHFTSSLAMRHLNSLVAAAPPPTRAGHILVACPPEEDHAFMPLMFTLFLRRRGWGITYLGANVPVIEMEGALATIKPALVIMSAQQLYTAATLLQVSRLLQQQAIPLAFGGRIFQQISTLSARIPGHFLGSDMQTAIQMIEQILTSPPAIPQQVEPIPPVMRQAVTQFRQKQFLIDAGVWQLMAPSGMPHGYLAVANQRLSQGIVAALSLGDINYLNTDLDWVGGMLSQHSEINSGQLNQYLQVYHQVVKTHLDQQPGELVSGWLATVIKEIGV